MVIVPPQQGSTCVRAAASQLLIQGQAVLHPWVTVGRPSTIRPTDKTGHFRFQARLTQTPGNLRWVPLAH